MGIKKASMELRNTELVSTKRLASLVASKKALEQLLEFLKTTEVVGKEKTRERKIE